MRYVLDWCLFGYPQGDKEIASTQCTTACGRISSALEINLPNASASSTYDYCQDPEFLPNVGSCASCYKNVPNQLYLSNCKHSSLADKARFTERSMQSSIPSNIHARNNPRPCYRFLYNLPTSSPINPRPTSHPSAPVTSALPHTVSRTKLGSPLQSPFLLLFSSSFRCSSSTSMSTRTLLKNVPTTATTTQATNTTTAKSTSPNPPRPGVKARHGKAPILGTVPPTLARIKCPTLPP